MKKYLGFTSVCCVLALATQASATVLTSIPGVFSTGVDAVGIPLASGAIDPHYTIASSPQGPVSAKATAPFFLWAGATATSSWINDSGTAANAADGDYIYSLTFSLAGFEPATASISGLWTSDNTSHIYLNGNDTGYSLTNPWGHTILDNAFTINSGFVAGDNILTFVVHNDVAGDGNPTGLQVQIQNAVVAVPEPTAAAIFSGLGILALMGRDHFAKL